MSFDVSPLAEIAEVVDSLHRTPSYAEQGHPMVRVTDVKYGELDLSKTLRVDDATFTEFSRRYTPSRGDIIITRVGTYGVFGKVVNTSFCLGQNTAAIIPKSISADYLYAVLNSDFVRSQIEAGVVGSTQKTLSLKAIKALQIPRMGAPREAEVASFSSSLDDRITLLRETNATLEAIAQALFKSWFVDFDPVRAKMAGLAPEGMDEATAALFPDALEETELGLVPKGWRCSTVGESFVLTMGQSPPGDTYNEIGEGLAFYQGRTDFGFRFPTQRVFCSAPTRIAEVGDTLVSVRAPVGDVNMAIEQCCIGRGVASVRHEKGYRGFTFYAMRSLGERFKTFDSEGTVFGSINKKDFQNLPVIIASESLLGAYDDVTAPIDQRVVENEVSIRTLSTLRDTLLPRLISGQLRLTEALPPIPATV